MTTILNLVLFSDGIEYDKMYQITSKYYLKFKNVKTVYYKFSNEVTDDYLMKGNILLIKGNDSYIPGILDKTIKCFLYFKVNNFDYIIRSNISTIINFDLLSEELNVRPFDFGGSLLWNLNWIDVNNGIVNSKYFNTNYISGTGIIFSNKMFKNYLTKIEFLDYSIIDDVAISLLVKQHFPDIIPVAINSNRFVFVPDYTTQLLNDELYKITQNNYIFYRNRNSDRNIDVNQMAVIIKYLDTEQNNDEYILLISIMIMISIMIIYYLRYKNK